MKDGYGVVGGIREVIQVGILFIKDIICLGTVIGIGLLIDQTFPPTQPKQQLYFLIVTVVLAVYLDARPTSNPGKRNYEIIWMLLVNRHPTLFKSFGYYEFKSLTQIRKEHSRGN